MYPARVIVPTGAGARPRVCGPDGVRATSSCSWDFCWDPGPNNNNTSKKGRATESLLPGSVEHRSARKHRCAVGVNGRLRVRLYSIQHLLWIFRAFVLCLVVGVRADLSCLPMSGYGLRTSQTSQTANQVQRRGEGKRHLEGPRGGGEGGVSRVYGPAEARVTAVGSRRPLEDAAASDAGPRSHPSEVLSGRRPPGYLLRGTL